MVNTPTDIDTKKRCLTPGHLRRGKRDSIYWVPRALQTLLRLLFIRILDQR